MLQWVGYYYDLVGLNYLCVKCCESETDERILKALTEALGPLSVSLSLSVY